MSNFTRKPKYSRRQFIAAAATFTAARGLFSQTANIADLVFLNGEVHTVNANNARVEALAVSNGRVLAAGSNTEMLGLIDATTRQIDLDGRTLIPGINDSHMHTIALGASKPPYSLDLTYPAVTSIADCVASVKEAVAGAQADEWIVGRGWDESGFSEGRAPTAADLDAVSPNNPVLMNDLTGHAIWVNSKALQLAGISNETLSPAGGLIVRDENEVATGVLLEGAAFMVQDIVPQLPPAKLFTALRDVMQALLARGVTSATDALLPPTAIALYNTILSFEQIDKLRMTCLLQAGNSVETLLPVLEAYKSLPETDPMWLQVAGFKILGDGIPTANKTAWLHQPYVGGGTGSLTIEGASDADRIKELHEMIRLIHAAGLQVGIHATGDRTIDTAVNAFESAMQTYARDDARHYVIHGDLASRETLARMSRLGIGVNFNPEIKHVSADTQAEILGLKRSAYQWPYRTALEEGVVVASSSDAPVTAGNWLQGMATSIQRTGKNSGEVSGPEQRITLDEAIRTYTWAPAWQDHAESYKGSLVAGMVADLCVLDDRLSELAPGKFAAVNIAMTVVNGKVVHDAGTIA